MSAKDIITHAKAQNITLAVAESCTGGMVAARLTDVSGASSVFDRGFVTYSNHAKSQMLGVNARLIAEFGAVSGEVAIHMALGAVQAIAHSTPKTLALATTGIAGPDGGSAKKPVGLVWFALAQIDDGTTQPSIAAHKVIFDGDRSAIRQQASDYALELLLMAITRG